VGVAARSRAVAGRPRARALVLHELVVDGEARAAKLRERTSGVGGGTVARLRVGGAAGGTDDVPRLALPPSYAGDTKGNQDYRIFDSI
jgi:hypothetical protein